MDDNKFEGLQVWKKSHQLTLCIYQQIKKFPVNERYALSDQLKRAASSIPTNIAEGNERKSKREFSQFLYTAKGSCAETKYLVLLSRDLGYIKPADYLYLSTQLIEISKMISGLIKHLVTN